MANFIDKQILVNGTRDYVIKYSVYGDGSGDVNDLLNNAGDIGTSACIEYVEGSTNGCSATLLWQATSPVPFASLPLDGYLHYSPPAVINNNAGTGKSGDISIVTKGLGAEDSLTIILKIRKS
jgi:hypothetical protein